MLDKEASGLTIAMMTNSLTKTPLAALSRPVCGVRKHTLIISLPGSVKGATENLESITSVLGHAVELARGGKDAGEGFHKELHGGHTGHLHTCHHHSDATSKHTEGLLSNDPTAAGVQDLIPVTRRARVSPYPMIRYEDALKSVLDHAKTQDVVMKSVDAELMGYVIAQVLSHLQ